MEKLRNYRMFYYGYRWIKLGLSSILLIVILVSSSCVKYDLIYENNSEFDLATKAEATELDNHTLAKSDVITAFQNAGYQLMNHYDQLTLHESSEGNDEVYTMHISLGIDAAMSAVVVFLDDGRMYLQSVIADQAHEKTDFADLNGDGSDEIIFQTITYGADSSGGNVYVFSVESYSLSTILVVAYGNTSQYLKQEHKSSFFYISDLNGVLQDDICDSYASSVATFDVIDSQPYILRIEHSSQSSKKGIPYTDIGLIKDEPRIISQGFY